MKKNNKRRQNTTPVKVTKYLNDKLVKIKKSGGGTVTFYYKDINGDITPGVIASKISPSFFKDEYGREKKIYQLVQELNDWQHDMGAAYYKLN